MKHTKEVEYQLTLLDLYADDIIKRIALFHSNLNELVKLVKIDDVDRLKEQHFCDWSVFAEKFWALLYDAPTKGVLYETVLEFIHRCESESQLHRHLHRLMEHNYRSEILQVLCRSKEFLEVMDPLTICKQLSILSDQHQRIFQSIQQIVPRKGAQLANKHILRSLPELGRETLFDFLHAVTVCGTEGERLVEQMIPNFQQLYLLIIQDRAENRRRGTVYFVGVNTTVRDVLDSCAKSGEACPFEVDISYQTFPPSEPQKIIDDVLEDIYDEDEIPLRHYQEELAEAAYNGQNTVVCAPTGSGKTVVAASVIRKHLLQGLVAKKRNKVCFLVSNTTFLEQQAELLRRFLRKRFKIIALSGATSAEAPRLLTIVDNDVVVITPQLIVNLIKAQNTEEDCVRFSLTMFSLLIFDEAHHTSESHPYNEIMLTYHDMKRTGAYSKSEPLPQVVGLTASLGVGKAKSEEEAREHILRMCANLDADVLSRVRRYESELREFSRIATDETILVMSSHNNTPFFHAIIELMGKFEKMFAEGIKPYRNGNSTKLVDEGMEFDPPRERDSQAYENWFESLTSRTIPRLTIDPREREKVFAYLQYIKVLYRSQQLCAHLPCDMAQSYLLDELDKLPKNEEISAIFASSNLRMRLDGQQYRNALYEKLLNVIRDEFHNKPDGRVIVFVRTREFACRLSRAFDSDQVLSGLNVRTKMITGINVSCEEGGQNANVQRDNLTDFANGKVKVLFATSVADEGIDIQKCTLVIKYNYTTNEIAHVQRRGRGRAKDSRCLLLTHDKKLKEREDQNILREKLMNMALEVIDRQSSTWFKQEIAKNVAQINEERIKSKALIMEQERQNANKIYTLRCRKCDSLMCSSKDIVTDRNCTQYICIDPNLWSRVTFYEYSDERQLMEQRFTLQGVGTHRCANRMCNESWGRVVKTEGVVLPVISAGAFVMVSETDERITCRKWNKIVPKHFCPRVISLHDYATMRQASGHPLYSDP